MSRYQLLTYLGDVEVEINVICAPTLTPEEPDLVSGNGTAPDPEPLLPTRVVSHSAKDQRSVLAQSSLSKSRMLLRDSQLKIEVSDLS